MGCTCISKLHISDKSDEYLSGILLKLPLITFVYNPSRSLSLNGGLSVIIS